MLVKVWVATALRVRPKTGVRSKDNLGQPTRRSIDFDQKPNFEELGSKTGVKVDICH